MKFQNPNLITNRLLILPIDLEQSFRAWIDCLTWISRKRKPVKSCAFREYTYPSVIDGRSNGTLLLATIMKNDVMIVMTMKTLTKREKYVINLELSLFEKRDTPIAEKSVAVLIDLKTHTQNQK